VSLPFSHDAFLDVFPACNRTWWPVAVVLWIATVAAIIQLVRDRTMGAGLAALLAIQSDIQIGPIGESWACRGTPTLRASPIPGILASQDPRSPRPRYPGIEVTLRLGNTRGMR
jgi:hypothetical protein